MYLCTHSLAHTYTNTPPSGPIVLCHKPHWRKINWTYKLLLFTLLYSFSSSFDFWVIFTLECDISTHIRELKSAFNIFLLYYFFSQCVIHTVYGFDWFIISIELHSKLIDFFSYNFVFYALWVICFINRPYRSTFTFDTLYSD